MIYGNIKNIEEFDYLPENIQKCFRFFKENDLKNFETGCYEIEGKDIFVNIAEYETTTEDKRPWEAHRKYLDIHIMLFGKEIMNMNFIDNMKQKPFKEEEDFLAMEGDSKVAITLDENDFLICYPNDAHMTAIMLDKPESVKKAIFKVKV